MNKIELDLCGDPIYLGIGTTHFLLKVHSLVTRFIRMLIFLTQHVDF